VLPHGLPVTLIRFDESVAFVGVGKVVLVNHLRDPKEAFDLLPHEIAANSIVLRMIGSKDA
jgi:hypothetical protein